MKKITRIMLSAGVMLVLGTGLVLSYMQARPEERLSDLTLANIEALGAIKDLNEGFEYVSKNYTDVGGGTIRVVCTCSGDGIIPCCLIFVREERSLFSHFDF